MAFMHVKMVITLINLEIEHKGSILFDKHCYVLLPIIFFEYKIHYVIIENIINQSLSVIG